MVKQTDSGFGVDAQADPGGPSSPDSPLHIRPLRMTFVMGGNSRAGSRCGPVSHSTLQEVSDHATSSHVTPEFPISAASMWDKKLKSTTILLKYNTPFFHSVIIFIWLTVCTIPFEMPLNSAIKIRGYEGK